MSAMCPRVSSRSYVIIASMKAGRNLGCAAAKPAGPSYAHVHLWVCVCVCVSEKGGAWHQNQVEVLCISHV